MRLKRKIVSIHVEHTTNTKLLNLHFMHQSHVYVAFIPRISFWPSWIEYSHLKTFKPQLCGLAKVFLYGSGDFDWKEEKKWNEFKFRLFTHANHCQVLMNISENPHYKWIYLLYFPFFFLTNMTATPFKIIRKKVAWLIYKYLNASIFKPINI